MKSDFFTYQAQTSPNPLALEISHANGSYIYDTNKKAYLDFVAGEENYMELLEEKARQEDNRIWCMEGRITN